jgi:hypothetical protein
VHCGRHREPGVERVERGDRCVGAEGELDPGVVQRPEREAPVGAVGPTARGDVAVVEQVDGLDAGPHAECGHPADVGELHQLGVLDAAARARGGEGIQRGRNRRVVDGVYGDVEPVRLGPFEQRGQLIGAVVADSGRMCEAVRVGVRQAAVGGAGVERAVRDDLEWAHGGEPAGFGQGVAGAQPGADHGVEPVGVDRRADAELVDPGGEVLGWRMARLSRSL